VHLTEPVCWSPLGACCACSNSSGVVLAVTCWEVDSGDSAWMHRDSGLLCELRQHGFGPAQGRVLL
jgi:hypothetical protein